MGDEEIYSLPDLPGVPHGSINISYLGKSRVLVRVSKGEAMSETALRPIGGARSCISQPLVHPAILIKALNRLASPMGTWICMLDVRHSMRLRAPLC